MKRKLIHTLPFLLVVFVLTSCTSVRIATDYDREVNFNDYKTFAFYKTGIDKAEISDLDKRRILRAIETELVAKGYQKSSNPDILVSIFTKSREKVNVWNNGWGWGGWGGWGWGPGWGWGWGGLGHVSTTTEGTLYIDLIDASKKELVWQGIGKGYLSQSMNKKEERIKVIVNKIMERYPPGAGQ